MEFPPDFSIEWDGQIYRPADTCSHTTKLGSVIRLINWETECPRCGSTFMVSTTMTFREPRRRCDTRKGSGTIRSMRRQLKRQIDGVSP